MDAAREERKESRMAPGFWPGLPFNEVGKASWEKIWERSFGDVSLRYLLNI